MSGMLIAMTTAQSQAARIAVALTLTALLALALVAPARATQPDDPALPASAWTAIRKVIGDQLAALRKGDGAAAAAAIRADIESARKDIVALLEKSRSR